MTKQQELVYHTFFKHRKQVRFCTAVPNNVLAVINPYWDDLVWWNDEGGIILRVPFKDDEDPKLVELGRWGDWTYERAKEEAFKELQISTVRRLSRKVRDAQELLNKITSCNSTEFLANYEVWDAGL